MLVRDRIPPRLRPWYDHRGPPTVPADGTVFSIEPIRRRPFRQDVALRAEIGDRFAIFHVKIGAIPRYQRAVRFTKFAGLLMVAIGMANSYVSSQAVKVDFNHSDAQLCIVIPIAVISAPVNALLEPLNLPLSPAVFTPDLLYGRVRRKSIRYEKKKPGEPEIFSDHIRKWYKVRLFGVYRTYALQCKKLILF